MAYIEFKNICKIYHMGQTEIRALDNISFDIDKGELCVIVGPSGAGKTTISDAFRENGFEIINCDIVAREVTQAGNECCKELAKLFPSCFDENYSLDRQKLGEIVFSDKNKLQMLNDTIYPFINKLIAGSYFLTHRPFLKQVRISFAVLS